MKRRIASLLLISLFVMEMFRPTVVWALTSGPDQPEFSSFTPASLDNMVDPFTGDFSYNLPLLSIPGYKGGYPLNMAYRSGVSPEQEASWVGLGWNLNPGAVSRSLRGLPDEFDGENDKVTKTQHIKDDVTFSLNVGASWPNSEAVGQDLDKVISTSYNGSLTLSYNTYTGLSHSFGYGMNVSLLNNKAMSPNFGFSGSLGPDGLTITPQAGLSVMGKNSKDQTAGGVKGSLSMSLNSNTGIERVGYSIRPTISIREQVDARTGEMEDNKHKTAKKDIKGEMSTGMGLSFANSSPVPFSEFPRKTRTITGGGELGVEIYGVTTDASVHFTWIKAFNTRETIEYKPYGYFNSHKYEEGDALMDYNRINNVQATGNSKVLSYPQTTPDLFSFTGQEFSANVRAYRNDVGIYTDPVVKSRGEGDTYGVEPDPDAAPGIKFSANYQSDITKSYSGPWRDQSTDFASKHFDFVGDDFEKVLKGKSSFQSEANDYSELVYFASDDEFTANKELTNHSSLTNNDEPVAAYIGRRSSGLQNLASFVPATQNFMYVGTNFSQQDLSQAETNVEHRRERKKVFQFIPVSYFNSSSNTYPRDKENHIQQVRATLEDGTVYMYGESIYVLEHKDVVFSVEDQTSGATNNKLVTYDQGDNTTGNNKGQENFFSETVTSPYPSKFLLTKIVTNDYVDYGDQGDSPLDPELDYEDMGEWVEFTYDDNNNSEVNYRNPMSASTNVANYTPGFKSNEQDDKGSYSYGTREEKYLKEIKTKTHKAVFELEDRCDNLYAASENGGIDINNRSQLLKSIKLYSIDENENEKELLKTIKFTYDYSLCKGIPNYSSSGVDLQADHYDLSVNSNNLDGKLTLLKVEVFDGESEILSQSYSFDYNQNDPNLSGNADPRFTYDPVYSDRWGTYQTERFDGSTNFMDQFPYSSQREDYDRDAYAAAFSLKTIHLPTGGTINVEYESDDYAHVEYKKAAAMYKVVGFASSPTLNALSNNVLSSSNVLWSGGINKNTNYLVVQVPSTPETDFTASDLIEDIDKLFFKVYMNLTPFKGAGISTNGMARDYIEGYADIEGVYASSAQGGWFVDNSGNYYAVVKIKNVDLQKGKGEASPIRKAAWQSLRYRRSDLFKRPNTGVGNAQNFGDLVLIHPTIVSLFNEIEKLIKGYYKYASGVYAKSADIQESPNSDEDFPSYVKLNAMNGKKYGGGIRVKSIWMDDEWSDLTNIDHASHVLGTRFHYVKEDGTTSGVACYEPIVGSEEIPHKKPLYYGKDETFKARDNAFYVEDPVMEAFYPAPSVGYERVVIQPIGDYGSLISSSDVDDYYVNIQTLDLGEFEKGRTPITVKEFYTAKEFPIISKRTKLRSYNYDPPQQIFLFIGTEKVTMAGHSQGFMVETNDMHGKPMKESVFPYVQDIEDLATSTATNKVEYIYNLSTGGFKKDQINEIESTFAGVDVENVGEYPYYDQQEFGVTSELYASARETTSFSECDAVIVNTHTWTTPSGAPLLVPIPQPNISRNENVYREFAMTKVRRRQGILKEVISTVNQSKSVQQNINLEANTGVPFETSTTNGFDDPVYEYNFPAHHYYTGLAPKYKDVDKKLSILSLLDPTTVTDIAKYYYYKKCITTPSTYAEYEDQVEAQAIYPDDVLTPGDMVILKGIDYDYNGSSWDEIELNKVLWVEETTTAPYWQLVDETGAVYSYPAFSTTYTASPSGSCGNFNPSASNKRGYKERFQEMNNYIQIISPAEKNRLGEQAGYVRTLNELIFDNYCPLDKDVYNNGQRYIPGYSTFFEPQISIEICNESVGLVFEKFTDYVKVYNNYGSASQCEAIISFNQTLPADFRYYDILSISGNTIVYYKPGIFSPMIIGEWNDDNACFKLDCQEPILGAWAKTYKEEWDYQVDSKLEANAAYLPSSGVNDYNSGELGRWYPHKNYVFRQIARNQEPYQTPTTSLASGDEYMLDIRNDGEYEEFELFPWMNESNISDKWVAKDELTVRSAGGRDLEEENALGIPSAIIYGYKDKLPKAVCSNCSDTDFGFDSFEDVPGSYTTLGSTYGNGKIYLTPTAGQLTVTSAEKHSGYKSLQLPAGATATLAQGSSSDRIVQFATGEPYLVSFWYKADAASIATGSFNIVSGSEAYALNDMQDYYNNEIDGWVRVYFEVTDPTSIQIHAPAGGEAYIDDIRVQPLVSSMTAYVYDPDDYKVIAVLDERNYATFFKYNDRNDLVNVNRETENGIYTVKSGYKNTVNQTY